MFQRFQLLPTGEGVFQCGLCRIQCIQFGLGLLCWQREETGVVNLGLQGIEFHFQLFQPGWQIIQLQLQLVREFSCFFSQAPLPTRQALPP